MRMICRVGGPIPIRTLAVSLILCAIFLYSAHSASAQNATSAVQNTQTSTTTPTTTIEDAVRPPEERRGALSDRVQQRIINLAANMSNRIDSANERLQTIADRLQSRINKMSTEGLNVQIAQQHLNDAQQKLLQSAQTMSTIDSDVAGMVSSENPRATWQQVRNTFVQAAQHLLASRDSLRQSIAALKNASTLPAVPETSPASSSATSSQ